jgi:hypothetical protein
VSVGGTHVHHLVWGILILLIVGYVGVTVAPPSPWHEILAVLFGIGTGLTLDEFALWLHLEDVYWSEEGRRSIDAVIVAGTLSGMALVGVSAWLDVASGVTDAVIAAIAAVGFVAIAVAIVNLAKRKVGFALAGLVIMPVGLIGAVRLAKPGSLWTRFYGAEKRARAEERFARPRRERWRFVR